MKSRLIGIGGAMWLIVFAVNMVSPAETIVSYNLNGSSFAATVVLPDISASGVGITGDWGLSGAGGNLFINGAANIPTGAIDSSEYVKFAINPLESTVNYGVVGIDFGGENYMFTTPYTVTIELRSSIDNYASVLGSDTNVIPANTTATTLKSTSFDVSGVAALQNVTSTTEFRFYVYDDSDVTSKTIRARVDNIIAETPVTNTPAPVVIGDIALQILPGNTNLSLSWDSTNGVPYTVQSRSNLISDTWQNAITNVIGNGGTMVITNQADKSACYYRVTTEN